MARIQWLEWPAGTPKALQRSTLKSKISTQSDGSGSASPLSRSPHFLAPGRGRDSTKRAGCWERQRATSNSSRSMLLRPRGEHRRGAGDWGLLRSKASRRTGPWSSGNSAWHLHPGYEVPMKALQLVIALGYTSGSTNSGEQWRIKPESGSVLLLAHVRLSIASLLWHSVPYRLSRALHSPPLSVAAPAAPGISVPLQGLARMRMLKQNSNPHRGIKIFVQGIANVTPIDITNSSSASAEASTFVAGTSSSRNDSRSLPRSEVQFMAQAISPHISVLVFMSCLFILCALIISYHFLSFLIISYHFLSFLIISYHVWFYLHCHSGFDNLPPLTHSQVFQVFEEVFVLRCC